MMRLIVFDVGGISIGDEICVEPSIRYAIKLYEGSSNELRVLANHPRIFSHLNIFVASTPDAVLKGQKPDMVIPCSPYSKTPKGVEIHPFTTYAPTLFISTVDFSSLFMLRRILPDKDKRPKIVLSNDGLEKLKKLVQPHDTSSLTIVHVGATAEDERFIPASFWNKVIEKLIKLGHTVAVFGSSERGPIAKVNQPVIDLVDKTDLDTFFALIANCRLLLTNDSSPVHVAGAFDTPIVVIPTLRHPDRLLHLRNGSKYYKARAVYKKLAIDDSEFIPERIDEIIQQHFTVFPDVYEYLPETEKVVEAATELLDWSQ